MDFLKWTPGAGAPAALSRRRFVQGLSGGLLIAAGLQRARLWGAPGGAPADSAASAFATARVGVPTQVLSGTEFNLEIGTVEVNFTGTPRKATAVNGQVPAPVLRWREGDTVTIRVTNRLTVPTSIHWHGVIVPADMDGVPGLSFEGIAPGATFEYRFKVNQSGTYWYHSHSRFQEQTGLYGAIVIDPRRETIHFDREHVLLLSDWTDADPEHLYRILKVQSDYYNFGQRTVRDFASDVHHKGWKSTLDDWRMWGGMRMDPTDLSDVSGYTYTYLANGAPPNANWTALFKPGEAVRLRLINGSSMSYFDVRIPGLKLAVIAADGQDVDPVEVDELRIAAGEVYDVLVHPREDRAYTIFAQSLDRSGAARGTLAPRPGMLADVPSLDPRPLLNMVDMGMGKMQDMSHMGMSGKDHDMSHMDPDMSGMSDHDMSQRGHNMSGTSDHDMSQMGHDMPGMSDHDMSDMQNMPSMKHGSAAQSPRFGPTVDSVAMQPTGRLDDPGVGLRNNGRQVLTYADLNTTGGPIDTRPAGREIVLHLTGHMERFIWSFDGEKFSESRPLLFQHGERVRITLINDTMMNHPIHLHGMWGEIEAEDGTFLVRKHTINVQPGQRISYLVTADALGRWAYHCHLLYHMEAGMFREVRVEHGT